MSPAHLTVPINVVTRLSHPDVVIAISFPDTAQSTWHASAPENIVPEPPAASDLTSPKPPPLPVNRMFQL